MRRLLSTSATLLLVTLGLCACQTPQTTAPEQASPASLPQVLAELDRATLDGERCMELDAQLRAFDGDAALDAQYARAELAWSCQDPMLWQGLHEELARLGYAPSFVRLSEHAVERGRWERVLELVEVQRLRAHSEVAPKQLDELELRAARALWHARSDKQDYELVEHLLERKLARAPQSFSIHLEFIELYLEYVGLGPSEDGFDDGPDGLQLAQRSESRARELARAKRFESAQLEFLSGFIRDLEGDREAALLAWREALRIDPDFVEPRLWLGLTALERQDYETARSELHDFLARHPEHESARYGLALATKHAKTARDTAAAAAALAEPDDTSEPAAPRSSDDS